MKRKTRMYAWMSILVYILYVLLALVATCPLSSGDLQTCVERTLTTVFRQF